MYGTDTSPLFTGKHALCKQCGRGGGAAAAPQHRALLPTAPLSAPGPPAAASLPHGAPALLGRPRRGPAPRPAQLRPRCLSRVHAPSTARRERARSGLPESERLPLGDRPRRCSRAVRLRPFCTVYGFKGRSWVTPCPSPDKEKERGEARPLPGTPSVSGALRGTAAMHMPGRGGWEGGGLRSALPPRSG